MNAPLADKSVMQNRLFAELSAMFGREVPLYDKSLLVNRACNQGACALLAEIHRGFSISDQQLDRTSGERHGAIRIGRPDEYGWVARFFAAFGMEPHNFYDMANVGAKSQPIVATAFRSVLRPEHRVFCSLLLTDSFDPDTKARVDALLATRAVFSDRAKALVERSEQQGGLDPGDADALIAEGVGRIFKWTGKARDYPLYTHLCDAGFKIAADIACFETHHLNHLTPNTFCLDLYTASMKLVLGGFDERTFHANAERALTRLATDTDRDAMRLLFKHLSSDEIESFAPVPLTPGAVGQVVDTLLTRLTRPDLDLGAFRHAGFKESTEGPSADTPILLRQDAYKALTEPVVFTNPDGTTTNAEHTARFGEIEQRGYATTPKGRALYDDCLARAEAAKAEDPALAARDYAGYQARYAASFAPFPKRLRMLLDAGLVHARCEPTPAGLAARGSIDTTDPGELARLGLIRREGLRYEDFLPVSAAGIFASNLNQYGTRTAAANKPVFTKAMLEAVMGRPIVESALVYAALEAESVLNTYARLGLLEQMPEAESTRLEQAAACEHLATPTPAG